MIKTALSYLFKSLISYIVRRCTGGFMDYLFDEVLTVIAESTENKTDDKIVERWKQEYKQLKK